MTGESCRPICVLARSLVPLKADKMLGAQTLKYLGKKGIQKPERLEGEPIDTLSGLEKGGSVEPLVLATTITLNFGETLEVNAIV